MAFLVACRALSTAVIAWGERMSRWALRILRTCLHMSPAMRTVGDVNHLKFIVMGGEDQALRTSMNASWGMLTEPKAFIRFFPSFCFSSSLRLRLISPP